MPTAATMPTPPDTPAWQERITGVPREQIITIARQFADNADKTHGKSMVIIGAAMNHWYHCDMNYRGIINMLMMCGCIGQRAAAGRTTWARKSCARKPAGRRWPLRWTGFARRASKTPPASFTPTPTSGATKSWVWKKCSRPWPTRPAYPGSMIDFNVRSERMGWLPSAPQLEINTLQVVKDAAAKGVSGCQRPRGAGAERRQHQTQLRRPGQPAELAAQHVCLALQHPGQLGQRA